MLELIIITPIIGGILAYILSYRFGNTRGTEAVALLGAVLSFMFTVIAIIGLDGSQSVSAVWGLLYMDRLSAFFTLITTLVASVVFLYSIEYIRKEVERGTVPKGRIGIYYTLLSFFLAAMVMATLASNLILMWGAIEATTLASTFLISFYNDHQSVEAAWKFFLINSVGIAVALSGILTLGYALTSSGGVVNFNIPSLLIAFAKTSANPILLKLAFAIILIGYGTKVGIVPMHTWLPDAHGQAPTPVSALLSGVLLNIAFYGILRIYQLISGSSGPAAFASTLLIFFGLISMIIGALRLYHQSNIKRMLAYSSIENMGIALLALGIGGTLGIIAVFLQIIAHSFAKPLAFMVSGAMALEYETKDISQITGVAQAMPVFGFILILTLVGVTGSLPFASFLSELVLIGATLSAGKIIITALIILIALVAFATMLYRGLGMAYGKKPDRLKKFAPGRAIMLAIAILLVMSICLTIITPYLFPWLIKATTGILAG